MSRNDPGIPLGEYLPDPDVRVGFHCSSCARLTSYSVRMVVERLKARGLGDERTGVRELGRLVPWSCPRCGCTSCETRPDFGEPQLSPLMRGLAG